MNYTQGRNVFRSLICRDITMRITVYKQTTIQAVEGLYGEGLFMRESIWCVFHESPLFGVK